MSKTPQNRIEELEGRIEENLYTPPESSFAEGVVESVIPRALTASQLSPEEAEFEKKRRERSETSRTFGSAFGLLGGMLTGAGIGGAVGKAGQKVASSLGGKALGRTAGGITEGLGLSATEASTEYALDQASGIDGAGKAMATSVGKGAAIGGALSGAFYGLGRAANVAFKNTPWVKGKMAQYAKGLDERKAAHEYRKSLIDDASSIEKNHTPESLRQMRQMDIGDGKRYNEIVGGISGTIDEPTETGALTWARRKLQRSDDKISGVLDSATDSAAENLRYGLGGTATDVALLAAAGPAAVITRHILRPAIDNIQRAIFSGLTKNPTVRNLVTSSLSQGKLATRKKIWNGDLGDFTSPPGPYTKYFETADTAASSLKIPALHVMTRDEFDEVRKDLVDYNFGEMEFAIRAAVAAKGVPQEAANPVIAQQTKIVNHLLTLMPKDRGGKWIYDNGQRYGIPQSELLSFSRSLRASLMPASVLHDFMKGTLTREAVKSWWATQPETANYLAEEIKRWTAQAIASGKQFTQVEQKMIGMITDPSGTKNGRLNDINLIQSLQATYAQDDASSPPAQVGGPGPKGSPSAFQGMFNNSMTSEQNIAQRAGKRR